jgi:hypothetical protein
MRSTLLRSCHSLLIAAAVLATPAAIPLAAQDGTALQADARVRLMTVGANRWVTGKLLAAPADSVKLLAGDTVPMALATSSLARLEVSRGMRRQTGRGLRIGTAVGAVAGFILGVATYEECTGFCIGDPGQGGTGLIAGVLGGAFGLGIGALIGSSFEAERWSPMPLPASRPEQ